MASFSSSFSQNQRWTKSTILWEVHSDWFAISWNSSRNSARTCRNTRNDKYIVSLRIKACESRLAKNFFQCHLINTLYFCHYCFLILLNIICCALKTLFFIVPTKRNWWCKVRASQQPWASRHQSIIKKCFQNSVVALEVCGLNSILLKRTITFFWL